MWCLGDFWRPLFRLLFHVLVYRLSRHFFRRLGLFYSNSNPIFIMAKWAFSIHLCVHEEESAVCAFDYFFHTK